MTAKKRKPISKGKRFEIFTRDGFRCRYCGDSSSEKTLVIDHVIPVSKGGTNDDDNLVTSCDSCNAGKSAKMLKSEEVPEDVKLRIAQERNEMIKLAKQARQASRAINRLRQEITNFYCSQKKTESISVQALNTLTSLTRQHGVDLVFDWIICAIDRIGQYETDNNTIRYICGIRRNHLGER
jgi:hypothetical protein